jgi:hypothetical protein
MRRWGNVILGAVALCAAVTWPRTANAADPISAEAGHKWIDALPSAVAIAMRPYGPIWRAGATEEEARRWATAACPGGVLNARSCVVESVSGDQCLAAVYATGKLGPSLRPPTAQDSLLLGMSIESTVNYKFGRGPNPSDAVGDNLHKCLLEDGRNDNHCTIMTVCANLPNGVPDLSNTSEPNR